MILNKITRINSALLMPCALNIHSHLISSKLNAFWFANDWTSNRGQKMVKSQAEKDKASKSESMSTPASESSPRRLFKRSSDQVASQTPTPQVQPSNQATSEPNTTQPTSQLSQQQTRKLSTYTLRTCQLLLNTFKDQAKQSKNVDTLLDLFDDYDRRLRQNNIKTTELKHNFKAIMYASVMRALSRILRREENVDRARMIEFLGKDYQTIARLDLSVLTTLEVSDFVAFFFLFQVMYKFRTFTEATVAVADKYLQQLYNRYTQQSLSNSLPTTRQQTANISRQDKRFVSELIIVAKTAQLFHSPLYQKFLDLLLQNITSQKLVPYKITAFAKFLLKPQNLTSVDKQLQLLNKLMHKMHSTDIMHDFDFITLKELYANLAAIVSNNSLMMDLQPVEDMLSKIQEYAIRMLPRMNSEDIYQFALYSLKRDSTDNYKLGRCILEYVFSQILPNGQTSLNPLFILSLITTNVDQPIPYTSIDPIWQQKFINMYNRYWVSDRSYPNLPPYFTQIIKFVNFIQSTPIKLTIMQSFISATAIVPYHSDSFLLENHYLQQMDMRKMYASLYRMEEMRQSNQKTKGWLRHVFLTLQKSHISLQLKKQLYQTEKYYIKGAQPLKQNRQMYIKTLSRYCQALGHEELIYTIFYQSLISIVNNRTSFPHPYQKQPVYVPQSIDQKCRGKVNALFHNFITISLELKLKLTQKDNISMVEKLKENQFVMLIKKHELFADMFVEVLALRDVATVVHHYASEEGVDFLLDLLRFLAVKEAAYGNTQGQSCNNSSEKYYFVYYQILKNYPIQKLSKILVSPQSKQAIDKILNPKSASTLNKIQSQGQSSTKTSRAQFVYDNSTDQVYISEQQVKILRKKVQKCLEIQSNKGQSTKLL